MPRKAGLLSAFVLLAAVALAQAPAAVREQAVRVEAVRGHMEFLAGEALQGRGSGTRDEHIAVTYAAAQMRMIGIEPAGDDGGYIQRIRVERPRLEEGPFLVFQHEGEERRYLHGEQMAVVQMAEAAQSGPLVKLKVGDIEALAGVERGSMVLLQGEADGATLNRALSRLSRNGAVALAPQTAAIRERWPALTGQPPRVSLRVLGTAVGAGGVVFLTPEAFALLAQVQEGAPMTLGAIEGEPEVFETWNAVGRIAGSDAKLRQEAVLLSAHIDHLGARGERVYFGADDDASGVTAVLELARALAAGPRPRRTVLVALYGSEEMGGLGSRYFIENPPVALGNIVANLQFEMIGRPDPNTPGKLWLTGYERSDLGAALAKRGAPLVADPYPQQNFFMRSDNYRLALRGVVAHTVSSFGLHKDYHQPTDTVEGIDFEHMARAIASLVEPVRWLADSDFRPQWVEGGRP